MLSLYFMQIETMIFDLHYFALQLEKTPQHALFLAADF